MPETIVFHRGHGLPYSKGLMAQSLSATGLSQERAFELARLVERQLADGGRVEIDASQLAAVAERVLDAEEGLAAVRRFRDWRRLDRLEQPLVVLLGGTTGVGKSTLASMLAARLGITRVIATDVVRQVLRAFFDHEAMPIVHHSAFEAGGIEGYREQAEQVGHGEWRRSSSAPPTRARRWSSRACTWCPGWSSRACATRCVIAEALVVVPDDRPAPRTFHPPGAARGRRSATWAASTRSGCCRTTSWSGRPRPGCRSSRTKRRRDARPAHAARAGHGRADREGEGVKLFIDTGSVAEVEEIAGWGVLSGATTNPSLLAKEEGDPGEIIRRICSLVDGPTSAEVVSDEAEGMVREGRALAALDDRVVVKVPFSQAGLAATRELTSEGIPVNMTLVFSAAQALLTAEAGATFVSCFMGRLDDISVDSAAVVGEIVRALEGSEAQVLAASLRHPMHAVTAATLGCPVATVPGKVLRQMLGHPLTDKGIERFAADWASRPEFGEWLRGLDRGSPRRPPAARVARSMPVLTRSDLEESPLADLHAIAAELGLEGFRGKRKDDLVAAILEVQGGDEGEPECRGAWCRRGRARARGRERRARRGARSRRGGAGGRRRADRGGGDRLRRARHPSQRQRLRARRRRRASRATTSTSRRPRSGAASCGRATRSAVRCARRGATSATRRWCASRASTARPPSRPSSGPSSRR